MKLKREMNATSSQDEFAKWAKIRRAHDKALAQYDEVCVCNPFPLLGSLWKSRRPLLSGSNGLSRTDNPVLAQQTASKP